MASCYYRLVEIHRLLRESFEFNAYTTSLESYTVRCTTAHRNRSGTWQMRWMYTIERGQVFFVRCPRKRTPKSFFLLSFSAVQNQGSSKAVHLKLLATTDTNTLIERLDWANWKSWLKWTKVCCLKRANRLWNFMTNKQLFNFMSVVIIGMLTNATWLYQIIQAQPDCVCQQASLQVNHAVPVWTLIVAKMITKAILVLVLIRQLIKSSRN